MSQQVIFPLAGLSFRPKSAKDAVAALEIGDIVALERDLENEYDTNAVKVLLLGRNGGDEFIGFVPKADNLEIASHLDADKPYRANVSGWAATNKPLIRADLFESEEEAERG